MNIVLTPFLAGWVVLACAVAGLAIYRKMIASQEDDVIHVSAESTLISKQADVAHRLDMVDRWGKLLTVVLFVCGILLAVAYGYQIWTEGSQTVWKG